MDKDNVISIEIKDLIKNKCKNKFVKIMRKYTNFYFNELESNSKIMRKETINLLIQTRCTLKNVHKLMKSNDVVDSNSLLRSAFENLIMAMMINESDDVYNEFIDLSIDDSSRQYTKPQKLRNEFRKVLKKINQDILNSMTMTELKDLLDELYDKMCMFTHSTLIVNSVVELKKSDDLDIYIFSLKQNAYFMEILLYLSLMHLCEDAKIRINLKYAFIGWIILMFDIKFERYSQEKIENISKLLYSDFNKEYLNKDQEKVFKIQNEFSELQKELMNNEDFAKELIDLLS